MDELPLRHMENDEQNGTAIDQGSVRKRDRRATAERSCMIPLTVEYAA